MGYAITQNQTAQALAFFLVQSSDHISALTGASPTVTISKNGGSFASPSGAVSEIGNGWYKVAGNATDSNTLGPLILHATATSADPTDDLFPVVSYNPQDATRFGLSALPNAAAAASGGLHTVGTGAGQIQVDGAGNASVNLVNIAGAAVSTSTAQLGVNLVNIAGTASAGAAGYVGLDWSAIHAPTTAVNLSGTTISTSQTVASVSGAVGSVTGAVGSVTGNVGGNVVGSVASVTGAVGSVTGSVGSISGVTFPTHFSSLAIDSNGDVTFNNTSIGSVTGAVASVTGNVGGNVVGSVASVTGSVGSISGVTFPTHFGSLAIDSNGYTTFNNTTISTVTNLTNLPSIPSGWLTAAGIAASALNGKGDWLLSSNYTAPNNTDIAAIYAKLPANNIADETLVISATNAILSAISSGVALAANGLDNVLVESGITASSSLTNDAGTQLTSINARQALALVAAMAAAVVSGASTGSSSTISFKQVAVPSGNTRVSATCDDNGNRTSVTLKVPT